MKEKFVNFYFEIARHTAKLSYAKRLQVGAVIVKDNNIISFGYNGTPSGWDNSCEEEIYEEDGFHITLKTKPEVIHAEANAITKLAKEGNNSKGSDLFVTHAPCTECAKLIIQAGIKRVYWSEQYRSKEGLDLLEKANIEIIQK